jgi:asparagine synthase (glutamine-hydrolysing)
MCGIYGFAQGKRSFHTNLTELSGLQGHRGPDGSNFFQDDLFVLGHSLLKIRDKSSHSQQPLMIENRWVLTFNGEIYSSSDSEIDSRLNSKSSNEIEAIRLAFIKFGINAFKYLNGMYAVCYYDKEDESITLLRDKSGQKPLYFSSFSNRDQANNLIWASELTAIARICTDDLAVNLNQLKSLLQIGFNASSETLINGINQVLPGQILKFDKNGVLIKKDELSIDREELDKFKSFSEIFDFTLSRHLLADTEIAISLSGGLDSGILAAIACRKVSGIKAFSTFFEGSVGKYNWDFYRAERLSKELGLKFERVVISKNNYLENMQDSQEFLDEPIYSTSLPTYLELAKRVGVLGSKKRVLISGSGGDELFAGYPHHLKYVNQQRIIKLIGLNTFTRLYAAKNKSAPNIDYINFWLNKRSIRVPNQLLNPVIVSSPITAINYNHEHQEDLLGLLNLDFNWLVGDSFQYLDRYGMRNNIEARSPFADNRLRAWCQFNLDSRDLINWKTQKHILLNYASKFLPDWYIGSLKKSGWASPIAQWYCESNSIKQEYVQTFNDYAKISSNEIINWKLLTIMLEKDTKYPGKWVNLLYSLVVNSKKLGVII